VAIDAHVIYGGAEGYRGGLGVNFNASPNPFNFFQSGAGGATVSGSQGLERAIGERCRIRYVR
jgi:hypothetical protein